MYVVDDSLARMNRLVGKLMVPRWPTELCMETRRDPW
jgi:hypothetical protein